MCISLNSFTDTCPSAASAATCVLCDFTYKLSISAHRRPQGGKNGHFPPWKLELRSKISRKREISIMILISWVNSWKNSVFADMTLPLQNSQVHCSGVMNSSDQLAVH